jgi:hypothetical protein
LNKVSKNVVDEEPCAVITSVLYNNTRVPLGLDQAFVIKSYFVLYVEGYFTEPPINIELKECVGITSIILKALS